MIKKNEIYKPIAENQEMKEIMEEVQKELPKFKDPVVLAGLLHLLSEEKENSNRLFKTIIERLDRIEASLSNTNKTTELLPDVDQKIIDYIKQQGHACAKDIKKELKYKGLNAASARLNSLCSKNILVKQQVGRKVYFKLK